MLTFRQQSFVNEYVATGNASQSYVAAGYVAKNSNVAAASASALLKNPKVAAAVESARRSVTDEVVHQAAVSRLVTAREIVEGLRTEARRTGKSSSHAARVQAWSRLAALLGLDREPARPDHPVVDVIRIYLAAQPGQEPSPAT